MKSLHYVLLLFFGTYVGTLWAQNIDFQAVGPGTVKNGQQFTIRYTVNAQGQTLTPGDFSDFNLLGGPSTSSSSSITSVNGKMTQTISLSYTYYLQAKKEGKFTISPGKIVIDGKEYTSNSVDVTVANGTSQQQTQGNTNNSNTTKTQVPDQNLFLKLILNKSNVYQGESIKATVKVYTRVDLVGFGDISLPKYNGFWKEDLTNSNVQLVRENVNGTIYNTAIVQELILTPQKSGKLIIEPINIECVIRQRVQSSGGRRSLFDDFFGRYEEAKVKIGTKQKTVNVKSLPAGAPSSFKGAVGKYNFNASITKNEVKTNEAITLKTSISGTGNLKTIEIPSVKLPEDFETYDPETKSNFKNNGANSSGFKRTEYLMIPRYAGSYTIPAVTFTYFDPSQAKYKTISKGPFEINVLPGEEGGQATIIDRPIASKQDMKVLGNDIRYIKTGTFDLSEKSTTWFGSTAYYGTYFGLIGLSFGLFLFLYKNEKDKEDQVSYKSKNANKLVQKSLKSAKIFLDQGNAQEFYKELLSGVLGYIGDRLKIGQSELNKENISNVFTNKGVTEDTAKEISDVINTCEMAQYASVGGTDNMSATYEKAVNAMTSLQSQLKKI